MSLSHLQCADDCNHCGFTVHPNQPYGVEIHTADGIFLKEMHIPDAGSYVPQHSHKFDHLSMLVQGSVRAWADGELLGDFHAPHPFEIPRGVKHTFLSLQDNTKIWCIHNVSRTGSVEIVEEHQMVTEV